jgi:hypothetical protein
MAVQQDVPHRAAADGRHQGDDGYAQPVEVLAARGQGAADGEHTDAEQIEDVAHQCEILRMSASSAAGETGPPRNCSTTSRAGRSSPKR